MKDYYKILQVAPDASTEVIQMAYKALAKKYHPDLNPGQEEAAQEKMKDVNEAYEILSDKDKRWQYDQIYYRQEKTAQKTSYTAPEPPKGAQTQLLFLHPILNTLCFIAAFAFHRASDAEYNGQDQ